jgi:LmbE family N-acetylglucosaminyl deacetylase
MSSILVLSPHPDDEAIGLGGTIRLHVERGDAVEVIFLTSGEEGVKGAAPEDVARMREAEARDAAQILGYDHLDFWREQDGALQLSPGLVDRLQRKIAHVRPELIYVPHEAERHPDHRAAAQLIAATIAPDDHSAPKVLMYEVWTPLHQIDHIEDISGQIETKLAAIRAHKCQCELLQFDEAACGLNRYRAIMHSWYGVVHAEVFRRFN